MTKCATELGSRIKSLRLERGLSQAELAGQEMSESYVSLIESGKRQPSRRAVATIADRLGSSVEGLSQHVVHEDPKISFALTFAELAVRNGDTASARSALESVGCDSRLNGPAEARMCAVQATLAESDGDLETATGLLEQLLQNDHIAGAAWAEVATSLVRCYRERGDLTRAVEVGERCTAHLVETGLSGTPQHVSVGLTMASAYHERGDVTRAANLVQHLVAESERVGSREARGAAYWNAALIAQEQGRQREAVQLAERALVLISEGDDARRIARLTAAQAWILLSLDEPQVAKAMGLLHRAYDQLEECGSSVDRATVAREIGQAEIMADQPVEAERWARQALQLLGDEPRLETARSWLILAQAQALQGFGDPARQTARLAAALLDSMEASRQAAEIWRDLGDLLTRQGDSASACVAYDRALASIGFPGGPRSQGSPSGSLPLSAPTYETEVKSAGTGRPHLRATTQVGSGSEAGVRQSPRVSSTKGPRRRL